jgi:tetratricopeptide (TPR) repeat protein
MGENAWVTAKLRDLELPDGRSPIRRGLGVRAFGVNAWTAREAGQTVIPEHDEAPSGHEELYLVLSGAVTFAVDDAEVDGPAGMILFVRDPATTRAAVAREAGTTVLVVGGEAGAAYRPRAWETNAEVVPLLDAGRYAEAARVLTAALDEYDDRAVLFFNLACAEAQLGDKEAALEHLAAAVRERRSLAAEAPADPELAPLRDDPRFADIVASAEADA